MDAEIARLPRDKTLPELLRDWAKVLDIPSGRFVNEDLEAAADALEQAQSAKDARALLEMMVTQNMYAVPFDWRTRIEAMLEQKP